MTAFIAPFAPALIEAAAHAAHEANRAYCLALGDASHAPWESAPDWQKDSVRLGVAGVLRGNSPSRSHAAWCEYKTAHGWRLGPVKDVEKKEHPCLLPYDQLPPAQQAKDAIFVATVSAIASALGPYGWRYDGLVLLDDNGGPH